MIPKPWLINLAFRPDLVHLLPHLEISQQTARKSTGGKAPRKQLATKQAARKSVQVSHFVLAAGFLVLIKCCCRLRLAV